MPMETSPRCRGCPAPARGRCRRPRQRLERFEDRDGRRRHARSPSSPKLAKSIDAGSGGQRLNSVKFVSMPPPTSAPGKASRSSGTRSIGVGPVGPGSVGLVAGQIGARHGDHAPRHNAGGTAGVGHRRNVASRVGTGDDFERNRRFERQPPRLRGAGVEPKKQAVDPDAGECGGGSPGNAGSCASVMRGMTAVGGAAAAGGLSPISAERRVKCIACRTLSPASIR